MSERTPDDELSGDEIDALAAWSAPPPPANFAERVLAARASEADRAGAAEPGPIPPDSTGSPASVVVPGTAAALAATPVRLRGWRRIAPWAIVGAAGLALLLFRAGSPGTAPDSRGSAVASERQTIRLGQRGVAVAEAGAAIDWDIERGRARVTQRAGDVFYRVERGGPFEVTTPHGTVRVTGTCFRVELKPMKTPWQGVVGVALGAAVVVTVYEGSVLFAGRSGERSVSAGQSLAGGEDGTTVLDPATSRAAAGSGAGEAGDLPAPPQDASRDELLRRDAVQRAEIAGLRTRVRDLERARPVIRQTVDDSSDPSGEPWFEPSREDLARFASECRVRADMPGLLSTEPYQFGPHHPGSKLLTDDQRAVANRVMAELQRDVLAQLRALYIEAIGDARADDLSPDGMASELRDKSPVGESNRINRRIAQERAGLAAPPTDLARLSPLERFLRRQSDLGDETERRLAEALGAAKARELRELNGGWEQRFEAAGCPSEDAP
jgi:hypothetical protein